MKYRIKISRNVFLCETLQHGMVSGIALTEEGGSFCLDRKNVYLKFVDVNTIRDDRNGRRWIVESVLAGVTTAAILGDYMLWHQRLGHPNNRVLKNMIGDFSCVCLPERLTKIIRCEDCAVAK